MVKKGSISFKFLSGIALCVFSVSIMFGDVLRVKNTLASQLGLPEPAQMLGVSKHSDIPVFKGLKFDPQNPLNFKFILDTAGKTNVSEEELTVLVNYFLAGLSTPSDDLWVNLSPYEKDRIMTGSLAETDLGKDMLGQDYLLKQLSSSITHPDTDLGKEYWKNLKTDDNFNKIWISADKAEIYENANKNIVLISESSLKVQTEKDYIAMNASGVGAQHAVPSDKLIDQITLDVNKGENFAKLRQIYNSLILAKWFKTKFADSFYKSYINSNKIAGIDLEDKNLKSKVFKLYVEAFNKGVYDLVKQDKETKQKRQYFSGGVAPDPTLSSSIVVPNLNGEYAYAEFDLGKLDKNVDDFKRVVREVIKYEETDYSNLDQPENNDNKVDGYFAPVPYLRLGAGPDVIGTLDHMFALVDIAIKTGRKIVQILPLNKSSAADSPYSVEATFLMESYLIGTEMLKKILPSKRVVEYENDNKDKIEELRNSKTLRYWDAKVLLEPMYKIFWDEFKNKASIDLGLSSKFNKFREIKNASTRDLDEDILYTILKQKYLGKEDIVHGWDFRKWPKEIRDRNQDVINALLEEHKEEIEYESFKQWVLYSQLASISEYARANDVELVIDLPFAVEGSDLWRYPEAFLLEKGSLKALATKGVAPDPFSDSGQPWQFYLMKWLADKNIDKVKNLDLIRKSLENIMREKGASEEKIIKVLSRINDQFSAMNMPAVELFVKRILNNVELIDQLRVDHVLGLEKEYLFYEDIDENITHEKTEIYNDVMNLHYEGLDADKDTQMALARDFWKLISKTTYESEALEGFKDDIFDDNGEKLKANNMILLARAAKGKTPPNRWFNMDFVVQKAVFEKDQDWLFSRPLYGGDNGKSGPEDSDLEFIASYLFDRNNPPQKEDSIRPCFFRDLPVDQIIELMAVVADAFDLKLVAEALGVESPRMNQLLSNHGIALYTAPIFGFFNNSDGSPSNHNVNVHIENAHVQPSLHDSSTNAGWWEDPAKASEREFAMQALSVMFPARYGDDKWRGYLQSEFTADIQRDILLFFSYLSKAKQVVPGLNDLLAQNDITGRINNPSPVKPEGAPADWTVRQEQDATLLDIQAALAGKESTEAANRFVNLVEFLHKYSKRGVSSSMTADNKRTGGIDLDIELSASSSSIEFAEIDLNLDTFGGFSAQFVSLVEIEDPNSELLPV